MAKYLKLFSTSTRKWNYEIQLANTGIAVDGLQLKILAQITQFPYKVLRSRRVEESRNKLLRNGLNYF